MEINTLGAAAIQLASTEAAVAAPEIDEFKLHFLNILSGIAGFLICALIVCVWALIRDDLFDIIKRTILKVFKRRK